MPSSRAFTLIELLIAVALGAVVCAAAAAAVRVAAQCVAAAERMAIENRLFRAGFSAALDELDHWRALNDPAEPRGGILHDASPDPADAADSLPFNELAWDRDFDQSDPKRWWRGLGVDNDGKDLGDYALFTRVGHPDPWRAAAPDALLAMTERLGHYALLDLLPANTIFSGYRADGTVPPEFWAVPGYGSPPGDASADPHLPSCHQQGWVAPRDVYVTFATWVAITADPDYVAAAAHRMHFFDFYPEHSRWHPRWLHERCPAQVRPLATRPAHWPALQATVRRFFTWGRSYGLATVVLTSPVTGATMKIQFNATGSTLGGARRQRDAALAAAGRPALDLDPEDP